METLYGTNGEEKLLKMIKNSKNAKTQIIGSSNIQCHVSFI
jgi:hypothetical protein